MHRVGFIGLTVACLIAGGAQAQNYQEVNTDAFHADSHVAKLCNPRPTDQLAVQFLHKIEIDCAVWQGALNDRELLIRRSNEISVRGAADLRDQHRSDLLAKLQASRPLTAEEMAIISGYWDDLKGIASEVRVQEEKVRNVEATIESKYNTYNRDLAFEAFYERHPALITFGAIFILAWIGSRMAGRGLGHSSDS